MPVEMSVRQWREQFRTGAFYSSGFATQCRAGWYNWFCQDHALAGRLKRYGFNAPEFDCRDIREMVKYINSIVPELQHGVIPPFIAVKDAVTAYAQRLGEPESIHIYRDWNHRYSYTSWRDRRKRTVLAVASLGDAPPGFQAQDAVPVCGLYQLSIGREMRTTLAISSVGKHFPAVSPSSKRNIGLSWTSFI